MVISSVKGAASDVNILISRITIDGRTIHLGYFNTIDEAKEVRQLKANQVFGVFTNACEKTA